jgi:hypothetical protein
MQLRADNGESWKSMTHSNLRHAIVHEPDAIGLRFQLSNPETGNCSLAWSLAPVETPQRLFGTLTGALTKGLMTG